MPLYGANKNPINADEHGNMKARAISRPEINDASARGKAYSITSAYTTSGGDEEILYIENTHPTADFEIHKMIPGTATNAVFTLYKVTGTAGGAGAVTPSNLNLGSTKSAQLSCNGDASVTGLTLGVSLAKLRVLANYSDSIDFNGSIVLPPNTALAVSNSATGACEVTVIGHFNSLEKAD